MRIRFAYGPVVLACDYWQRGKCQKGLHGGTPSVEQCFACTEYEGPSRGTGDMIAKAIKGATFGMISPCGGCKGRAAGLNDASRGEREVTRAELL